MFKQVLKVRLIFTLITGLISLSMPGLPALAKTTLVELNNLGKDSDVTLEVRTQDLSAARSKAKVDPIIWGRVKNFDLIRRSSTDLNRPTYTIAVFKVDSDGNEEWKSTTSHKYRLGADSARFRVPLGDFINQQETYRFYVLTNTGSQVAGPFEGTFTRGDDNITAAAYPETSFPDVDTPEGFTDDELFALSKYIAQRIIVKPQARKRQMVGGVEVTRNKNFVLTLPNVPTRVRGFRKVKVDNSTTATTEGNSITPRGNFNSQLTYNTGDIVTNDNASFIAKTEVAAGQTAPTQSNINSDPVKNLWQLIAGSSTTTITQDTGNTTNTTVINESINPRGAYDAAETYKKNDIVSLGTSSYLAVTSIPAGQTPSPSNTSYWMVIAQGAGISSNDVVSLPTNNTVKTASRSLNDIDGSGSGVVATTVTFTSSAASGSTTLKLKTINGTQVPDTFTNAGGNTVTFDDTGAVPVPDSEAEAYTTAYDFKFYIDSGMVKLINVPAIPNTSLYNTKDITIEYSEL